MARRAFSILLALLLAPSGARAQGFGQNQVRVRDFEWRIAVTEHFDIHYYEDSEPLVPFTAAVLERSYGRLSRGLNTGFEGRRKPFFLYATAQDMQQSNIAAVGDGTGGVTEAFKDRFMAYADGSKAWLDTVLTHELAHVFQFHVLVSGFWKSGRILKTIIYPLWMMEGMAEYFSWGSDDTSGEVIVRDAATSGGLIPLWKLERFSHLKPHQVRLAYESGEKVLAFLEEEYGPGKVEKMLKLFENRFETTAVLQEVTGLDVFAFDKKWREYAADKYARVVRERGLREPEAYGAAVTKGRGDLPEFNTSPVFTPDGGAMAFLSTRDGFPTSVMLKDLRTGRVRRLVSQDTRVENVHRGHFANNSRALTISPDGRRLAFVGTKNHRDAFYLYDLKRKRLERVAVQGLQQLAAPAFSPDGRSLAFSGMRGAVTDIFLLDLQSREVRRLTDDPQDDQTPVFSPDGRWVLYTSETERTDDPRMLYQRRLYRVRVEDGRTERVLELPGAARDPVVSDDGRRVLFALEYDGFHEIHEHDLASGRTIRLTRSVGAAYTPAYAPNGDIAFAALRRGSVHIHRGDRARFLAEPVEGRGLVSEEEPRPVEPAKLTAIERRPYRPSFSTDLFLPAFFFSSSGGLFWTSYWQGSDMLGDHQLLSFVSYASGPGFLDYQTQYGYNRWRTKLSAGAVGRLRKDLLDESTGLKSDTLAHTEFVAAAYPLDRFHRLEAAVARVVDFEEFTEIDRSTLREARIGTVSFVRDTVRGRYLVANSGNRLRLSYLASPESAGANFAYQSVSAEAHHYVRTGDLSALVLRGLGVRTWGDETPQQILGGIGGVRGYGRSTVHDVGSHLALATAEWRVPLWSNLDYYMWYIFPDFYFKMISLAFFTDAGLTWDSRGELTGSRWRDVRHSYGVGVRLHTFILQLFPLVLHFDYARRTTSDGGVFYVYLGPLF